MPKIEEIELTPNPDARKFVLKEPLTYGISKSFENLEDASDDELGSALFMIPHVTNVFYVDSWLTVTQDGAADWEDLLRELAVPIREAKAAGERSVTKTDDALGWLSDDESLSDDDRELLSQVNRLLDDEIRPYLQGDGGDVFVVGLEDKILQIHYQGACGSCPSSLSGTLMGIEGLVRRIDPELSVIAV